jgi:hypothetical protein
MDDEQPVAELARTKLDGQVYIQVGGTLLVPEITQLILALDVLQHIERDASVTVYPSRIVLNAPKV